MSLLGNGYMRSGPQSNCAIACSVTIRYSQTMIDVTRNEHCNPSPYSLYRTGAAVLA